MDSVPNEITAQGLRRVEGRVDSEELARSAHGHIKTGGQVDFKDPSADDKELRRASGVEKRVHDSLDHAAARREQASSAEVEPQHHDRRPGFGHTRARPSQLMHVPCACTRVCDAACACECDAKVG